MLLNETITNFAIQKIASPLNYCEYSYLQNIAIMKILGFILLILLVITWLLMFLGYIVIKRCK